MIQVTNPLDKLDFEPALGLELKLVLMLLILLLFLILMKLLKRLVMVTMLLWAEI